jgi:hypothetical protein
MASKTPVIDTVYITEPCMIDGKSYEAGEVYQGTADHIMDVVSAGRGTIDKEAAQPFVEALAAKRKAEKSTKVETA